MDNAGNTAIATVGGINIDVTPPVVVITGIVDGAIYDLGAVPQAGCATTDALSGVATAAVAAVSGGTSNGVGTYAVACTGALDIAGNSGSASAQYSVRYVFTGFFYPLDNPPTLNGLRAGQIVPVKFGLAGDHGLDVLLEANSVVIACESGVPIDSIEETVESPGANEFSYDPAKGVYQFNWKTLKSWANSCRRLLVKLDDGTVRAANFRFQ